VLYHLYGRHLDTGLPAPYSDDHWRQVVSRLGLSKHQVGSCKTNTSVRVAAIAVSLAGHQYCCAAMPVWVAVWQSDWHVL
jgi:hypothetical protein